VTTAAGTQPRELARPRPTPRAWSASTSLTLTALESTASSAPLTAPLAAASEGAWGTTGVFALREVG